MGTSCRQSCRLLTDQVPPHPWHWPAFLAQASTCPPQLALQPLLRCLRAQGFGSSQLLPEGHWAFL
jgi:hypothetical protein